MKRALKNLANKTYDVLVVGGGIHGALAAWDATLRGLSVALIERGDFGCVTSQNSLKIVHGGLRYLQDGNPQRVRVMARERTTWMQMAPHLVHPQMCLMPTAKKFSRSRLAIGAALALNDLLSYDRNRLPDPEKTIQAGKTISVEELAELLPGYDTSQATGAAVWNDGLMYNSERLVLEFILSAAAVGADIANYTEAIGLICEGNTVTGVQVSDRLSGKQYDIRAKVVINSTGAWIDRLPGSISGKHVRRENFGTSVAIDLIVDQVWADVAAGLPSRPVGKRRSQMLFIVPWRDKSIIGTWHIPWPHSPDDFQLDQLVLQDFINEINSAHPALGLTLNDIRHVNWGFLPVSQAASKNGHVRLVRDSRVIDHQKQQNVAGLISIMGVKYTTARVTAEKAIDLALQKLKFPSRPCLTETTPVQGGKITRFDDFLGKAFVRRKTEIDPHVIRHLVYTYGSEYPRLIDCMLEHPELAERVDPGLPVTRAEIIHAIREEMALRLVDIIQRRTELGTTGLPSMTTLETCAQIAAGELGWNRARIATEIQSVLDAYPCKRLERTMA